MIITPYNQIIEELEEIESFLSITMSDNPEEIIERGNTLQVYLARSAKLVADAEYYLNDELKAEILNVIERIIPQHLSATVQNTLVKAIAKDQRHVVLWSERLNRACVHQLDWCRSRLSYEKEQLRNNYPVQ